MMLPDLDTIILAKLISTGYKFYDHLSVKLSCFLTYLDPMVRTDLNFLCGSILRQFFLFQIIKLHHYGSIRAFFGIRYILLFIV